MAALPATPAAHKRETQARMRAVEEQLDKLVAMGAAAGPSSPPTFTDVDVEEVSRLLVEGRIRLPTHARLTVTTTVEETRSKVFGSSEVFAHTADQLHTRLLRPMNILDALEAGLIRRIERGWVWSEVAYERLAKN
jgi:hypothetical protein